MTEEEFIGLVIDDKYRLDSKIGEGGMGAVYKGTQLMVDRHVAIKLLHSGLNEHARIKQRFEVEAKAIGRMHHPNCITLFDFGFSSELDAFYMVMEYLEGTPMNKKVYEGVTADEAVEITRQVALALDHAHHQGILHRDLKPENVMITRMTDGSELTKVLDFGIARIFSEDDSENQDAQQQNRLTKAGEVFGTPAYISPEQARGERELTPASDLYSLGVMLFEMLTGDLPFWGDTAMDTIMKHITEPVPAINRLDISKKLKDLTYALLSKAPVERPQSGKALVEELDHIILLRKQAALQDPSASSSVIAGAGGVHATLPDLTPSDYNEWSKTEATVVKSAAQLAANPPPNVDMSFGAQRAPSRAAAQSSPPRQTSSTGPIVSSLDDLEDPYKDLTTSKSSGMLTLLTLGLILLIAAGVGLFLLQRQKEETPQEDVPLVKEQASTFTPDPAKEDPVPDIKDDIEPDIKETTEPDVKDDTDPIGEPAEDADPPKKEDKPKKKKTTPKKKKLPKKPPPKLDTSLDPFKTKGKGTTSLGID